MNGLLTTRNCGPKTLQSPSRAGASAQNCTNTHHVQTLLTGALGYLSHFLPPPPYASFQPFLWSLSHIRHFGQLTMSLLVSLIFSTSGQLWTGELWQCYQLCRRSIGWFPSCSVKSKCHFPMTYTSALLLFVFRLTVAENKVWNTRPFGNAINVPFQIYG